MGGCLDKVDDCSTGYESFYEFSMPDIEGKFVSFEKYRGKVILVVNVATQ